MSGRQYEKESYDYDLLIGLFLGLLGGALAGILFAPKPGKELQDDLQKFAKELPEEMNERWSRSKVQYKDLAARTKYGIEDQLEKRALRKRARRMAEAKRREELEAGAYEY
jgi:gas vesicle protein